jgi:hypothetical protein
MNNELLMGMVNDGANGTKQMRAFPERERGSLAVLGNRLAVNVLHDDVRTAIVSAATVEDCCNVGMREVGENLPFTAKAADDQLRIQALSHEFYGDVLGIFGIAAYCQVDDAHTAAADFAEQFVGSEA